MCFCGKSTYSEHLLCRASSLQYSSVPSGPWAVQPSSGTYSSSMVETRPRGEVSDTSLPERLSDIGQHGLGACRSARGGETPPSPSGSIAEAWGTRAQQDHALHRNGPRGQQRRHPQTQWEIPGQVAGPPGESLDIAGGVHIVEPGPRVPLWSAVPVCPPLLCSHSPNGTSAPLLTPRAFLRPTPRPALPVRLWQHLSSPNPP